jgi:hypothetical protein
VNRPVVVKKGESGCRGLFGPQAGGAVLCVASKLQRKGKSLVALTSADSGEVSVCGVEPKEQGGLRGA